MTDLIRSQIDFIYFVYGLGFILLIPICLYLHRRPRSLLPWMWLLLFGATHGLLEWLDLVALSLGTDPVFDVVRLGLLILSFLLLAEFGRAGLVRLQGRGPGRWVLAILLGLALLGAFAGLPGVRASARYSLGLVGALGAAAALWLAAHRAAQGRRALQGAALCLAGYAAAAGLVVDPAPFFPASWLNTEVFLAATGVPIQLGRGFLAAGLSVCLSLFAVASLAQEKHRRLQRWGRNLMVGTVVSVLVLVITGWYVTQYLGHAAAREVRTDQEHHGQVLEVSLTDKMTEADHLVTTLAGAAGIISFLSSHTSQSRARADAILDRYSAVLSGAIMYVLDREGLTIASSNRLAPDSFLGKSYAFRPYYRQALQGGRGSYWALGVTSGELGYYASFPVRDDRGEIIGVAVIKRSMKDLKGLFPPEAPAVIINADGVVTLTNRPDMHFKSLWPLSVAVREQLSASRQFGPGPFAPILEQAPGDGGYCRFQGQRYLVLRQPLPFLDWSVVILSSPRPIAVARMLGLSIAILLCFVVLSLLTIMGLTIESTSRVQRSENRFRYLYGNLRDGSAVVDMSGNIVEWNPAFQAMLGYPPEELIKLSLQDITPETRQDQEARIIAEQVLPWGYSNLYEQEYRRRDGSVVPVELQTYLVQEDEGQPMAMWVFVRDITERKKAEEERLRFSKLESLGTLAGGIAHDFNNIIAAIMGNIEMARMDNKLGERTQKRLEQAEKGCHRARDLTKKLLTFAKGGAPAKKPMFIGQLINESAQFALIGSNVKGEIDIPKDLWPVEVDEAQITQVMHDIVINAQQAMPDGGEIQISAENTILEDDSELPLNSGKYVRVALADQGEGIPPENLRRIFDPYFSTKAKGSGLGLAAAYSIIKGHGGFLSVDSKMAQDQPLYFTCPLPIRRCSHRKNRLRNWFPVRAGSW